MATFNLLVAKPDRIIFQEEVISAIFPGKEGSFEVLAHHAPLIALVNRGTVQIVDAEHQQKSISIEEGIFEFYKNQAILL